MPEYRIYKLNGQGHATGPALVLICGRDADVIQRSNLWSTAKTSRSWTALVLSHD
jgi:hypothetical protein